MAKVYEFEVPMTCQGCVKGIQKAISSLGSHAQDVVINFETKRVQIKSDLDPQQLMDAIKKSGKEVKYIGEK